MSTHETQAAGDGQVHAHISPSRQYWAVFAGLIVLTVVTVGVSYVDLGTGNTVVAVVVASLKAALVAAFFMHLRYDKLFHTVAFLSAFVFLGLFLFLTMADTSRRGRLDEANGTEVLPTTGAPAPGGFEPDTK